MDKDQKTQELFFRLLGQKEKRKMKLKREGRDFFWTGVGSLGLIGWSVAIPTILGTCLGYWIDTHHPHTRPWTLSLLVAGLFVGCVNAWVWVSREGKKIEEDEDKKDE